MQVQLELWHLILLLLAFFSAAGAFGKILLEQIEKRIGDRFSAQDKAREEGRKLWDERFGRMEEQQGRLERDLLELRADLPIHYVRREDFVRNQTVLEAKLDAVALRFENWMLKENRQ